MLPQHIWIMNAIHDRYETSKHKQPRCNNKTSELGQGVRWYLSGCKVISVSVQPSALNLIYHTGHKQQGCSLQQDGASTLVTRWLGREISQALHRPASLKQGDTRVLGTGQRPKWHPIPYIVHYLDQNPMGHYIGNMHVVHYIGNRVPFERQMGFLQGSGYRHMTLWYYV